MKRRMWHQGPRTILTTLGALAVWLVAASAVRAQVFPVDRRPEVPIARSFDIKELALEGTVRDQVAQVQVRQTFHNPGSRDLEAEFLFPVPEDAGIQDFVLIADGKELPGRILPKEEARRIYEGIVRSKKDPALLEYMGRGLVRTSVFPIPPGADRSVTLRYTQVLRRDRDVVELSYPLGVAKFASRPVGRLLIDVKIEGKAPIKTLYSPGHDVRIERSGDREARVRLDQSDVIPTADFRLLMTMAEGDVAATVLSTRPSAGEDGYFLLLASPRVPRPDAKPKAKTVVCVLDKSGSMSGRKIEQARGALRFVLENLREGDLFNIITYDDQIENYKPELQRFDDRTREDARRFVDRIEAGGSTNIDGALRAALEMLRDDGQPSYVLFLTDGLPTSGETKETVIAAHAKEANRVKARLFAFGVGDDVNARLLDRLSGGHGGTSEYVRPGEDIEAKVSRFYARLTSPVLTDIRVAFEGTDISRTYPKDLPDLFEGGQIVWVGRYRDSGKVRVKLDGKVGGETQTLETTGELAEPGRGSSYAFVERLWAVRRVGSILDEVDLHGSNRELIDELVDLSKKYGILTPYTSFLADENQVQTATREELRQKTQSSLDSFGMMGGAIGVGQRANKQAYLGRERGVDALAAAPVLAPAPAAAPEARSHQLGESIVVGRSIAARPASAGAPALSTAPSSGPTTLAAVPAAHATAPGQVALAKSLEGKDVAVATVRTVGAKTFFKRGDAWVDSSVKPDQESKATVVVQFTDEYFQLAKDKGTERNVYLTFNEAVVVELDGTVYRINPPAASR
jgi:Ca-activated chloride channel family protein